MKLRYLATVPVVLGALLLVHAKADPIQDKFRDYDTNHDGKLSGDELSAAAILPQLDLDGDGSVTLQEARRGVVKLLAGASRGRPGEKGEGSQETGAVFKRLDQNQDGRLTAEELPRADWLARLDADGDGGVTLEEARKVLGDRISARVAAGAMVETPTPADDESLTEAPQMLKGSEHGVGHRVADVTLKDLDGKAHRLSELADGKPLVIGLFGATCPISNKLGPEVARLEKDFASRGVAFAWVCPVAGESDDEIRAYVKGSGVAGPVLRDADKALIETVSATTTTEVFVLDAARTLVYRGAVNDQYGLGYAKAEAREPFLREALEATLRREPPAVVATSAPGCALDLPEAAASGTAPVSYHNQIARILQNHCVECHREGGLGPFRLDTYEDVIEHAGMIRKQVDRGAMPPWFASPAQSGAHAIFANDRSLSERDKADLLSWLATKDRPKGDPAEAPVPRTFATDWVIGEPDALLQIPRPFNIKAEGTMPYQNAVVETTFPEDRWVQAYEIRPTNTAVVHHVIVKVHPKGSKISQRDEGADGFWAAYVPGNSSRILPEGFAKKLPAGARLSFQIHYTPNGRETQDQVRIGLKFAKEEPRYVMHVAAVANPRIQIPPGEEHHVETRTQRIPFDMTVTGFMPHLHTRGKAFKYEITYPDGRQETLLDVPRYDFNWQLQYVLSQPKRLPAGSEMKITAVYDNSDKNPANPDPTKLVRWGQQTTDEMMIGYVEHYTPVNGARKVADSQ